MGVAIVFAAAACAGETEVVKEVVTVEVERVVEKEVVRMVPIERIVTVEVVMEKEIIKEVPVVREVVKEVEVEKIVVVQATPRPGIGVEQAKYGGTLRVASGSSLVSLDPGFSLAAVTTAIANHLYEMPFGWDANLDRGKPRVVGSWDVTSDGLNWTFTIRPGLTFHNGSPLTTDDVVQSLERWWERHPGGLLMKPFMAEGGLVKLSDTTWAMRFEEAYGLVLEHLGTISKGPYIFTEEAASVSAFEDFGEENIIGTGAYKLATWEFGNRVVLERYEAYIPRSEPASYLAGAQVSYLDRIEWLEISNEETKIAGLKTGEWDVVDGAGLDQFHQLQDDSNIDVAQFPKHQSNILFHVGSSPTDNIKVRQAIRVALDHEEFMRALGPDELWELCPALYYCGTPLDTRQGAADWYNQKDIPRAKALLEEAGYAGEELLVMSPTDYATITPLGTVLKPTLDRIGINVNMPAMDWATLVSKIGGDDWNIFVSWSALWATFSPESDSSISGAGGCCGPWKNDRVIELNAEFIRATTDLEKLRIVGEIQELVYEGVPRIWLGQFSALFPHRSWVKNFSVPAVPLFTNVWLEK